jgi:hypothetical protein
MKKHYTKALCVDISQRAHSLTKMSQKMLMYDIKLDGKNSTNILV